jgi:hypothetical protein
MLMGAQLPDWNGVRLGPVKARVKVEDDLR